MKVIRHPNTYRDRIKYSTNRIDSLVSEVQTLERNNQLLEARKKAEQALSETKEVETNLLILLGKD